MIRCLRLLIAVTMCCLALRGASAESDAPLRLWAVDPHIKVFRDAQPPAQPGVVALRAARNEYQSAQVVVRSRRPLDQLQVELSALRHADGKNTIAREQLTWNFVGYIPLKKNTRDAEAIRICEAPCEVPDPLLERRTLSVPAETAQPVWLTVHVPNDAAPGVYNGQISAVASDVRAAISVELTVDPFTLPDQRHLMVTNWFNPGVIAEGHHVELWSEPFWAILARYAQNMAAHRQNVFVTPWSLVRVVRRADGTLAFEYDRFDRYVELFLRAGVDGGIEIEHVAGAKKGWGTEVVLSSVRATDEKTGQRITLDAEEGLRPLLADLQRHLDQPGWLAKAMIHVSDEPIIGTLASWRAASEFVHRAAPRLRRIDAIETIDFSGALEVWVPQLCHFDRWRQAYDARRGDGEFWYYICCNPYGNVYPNRFLDYPLSRVRALHWINFSERLTGYLHWGLCYWGNDPFGVPSDKLPPGDTHIIYPGREGPLNSIRWEIQRESIEDYEYLTLLTDKMAELKKRLGPAASWLDPRRRAEELSRRVVRTITDCETDPAKIRAAREAIADEIIALDGSPLLVVQTEPPEGSTLFEGPISIEVHGIASPGTTVKLAGAPVEVSPNGTFVARASGSFQVEAEHDGQKRTIQRHFVVRR